MKKVSRQEFMEVFSKIPKLPEDANITFETELAELDLDSLDMAELSFDIEDEYGVILEAPEEPPKTVEDLYILVSNAKPADDA